MTKSVFDIIKKQNGENFAKTIRNYDNGIFDIPDIVNIVKYSGHDAEPLLEYLESLKEIEIKNFNNKTETPFELLNRAGYSVEYADILEKQNNIKKYFKSYEELCTFKDNARYERYYILNAVRYDVDKIIRENFTRPRREDDYGISVISIQILKTGGFISIKNRYNHAVKNPDNTFGSNPDNIIDGLSASIKQYFKVDFSSKKVSLPGNYVFMNNKIIQFHTEHNNVYYGKDFYVKDGILKEIDKTSQIMFDLYVLDLKNCSILDEINPFLHQFNKFFNNNFAGGNVSVSIVDKITKVIKINNNGKQTKLTIINNKLSEFETDKDILSIDNYAFCNCLGLTSVKLSNGLKTIGAEAFSGCTLLKSITIPASVFFIESGAFQGCKSLESITIPGSVKKIGYNTFFCCQKLRSIIIRKGVEIIGNMAFAACESLTSIKLPNSVKSIEGQAFVECQGLSQIIIPGSVKSIGNYAFDRCRRLKSIIIQDGVESIGISAFKNCTSLTSIIFPDSIKHIDYSVFAGCTSLKTIKIPDSFTSLGKYILKDCTGVNIKWRGKDYIVDENGKLKELKSVFTNAKNNLDVLEKIEKSKLVKHVNSKTK